MQFVNYDIKTFKINGKNYDLYVADDNDKRIKGLAGINTLSQDKGMIFEYENCGEREFTMENTNIYLCIIFLDENMNVIKHEYANPRQQSLIYCDDRRCKFVIEIPG